MSSPETDWYPSPIHKWVVIILLVLFLIGILTACTPAPPHPIPYTLDDWHRDIAKIQVMPNHDKPEECCCDRDTDDYHTR